MKQIFKEFVAGDSVRKLAIIADLSTILGVSIATFVAGPFLSRFAGIKFVLSDFILSVAFYFICIYLAGELLFNYIRSVVKNLNTRNYRELIGSTIFALLVLWMIVVTFPYIQYFVGNAFNVSYLLPQAAGTAVKDIDYSVSDVGDDTVQLSGKMDFSKEAKPTDYIGVLYIQDEDHLYSVYRYGKGYDGEYQIEINKSGAFTIPINHKKLMTSQVSLVIYRRSDWSLVDAADQSFGYPNRLTQIPSESIQDLEARVFDLNVRIGN